MPTLKLFWESVQNAVSYNIYYKTTPGVTIENGTLITNVTSVVYYHRSLQQATSYYYIIVAVDALGNLGTPSAEFGAESSVVSSFGIIPLDMELGVGTTQQYHALINYSDGGAQDVTTSTTWDTDNHSLATIDGNGLLTTLAFGDVAISAHYTTYDAYTSASIIHILMSIAITPSSPTIDAYATQQFAATGTYDDASMIDISNTVTWDSTSTSIATIDGYGLATGLFHGSTNITATLGMISATPVPLTVVAILESISITPSISPSVDVEDTLQFTAIGHYNDSSTLDLSSIATWDSSDESKATIDADGLATGIFHGSTNITATFDMITSNTVSLAVIALLESLSIAPTNPTVTFPILTQQFTATGHYNDSSTLDLTNLAEWDSDTPANATIDAYGLATIVDDGYSIITATYGIFSDSTGLTGAGAGAQLVHWVMADTGITKNISDVVSLWEDQSGNNTDWLAASGSITWVDNQINNLPVLRGGGINSTTYFSQPAFLSGSTNGEALIIIKSLEGGTNYGWSRMGSDPFNSSHYTFSTTDIYEGFGVNTRRGPFTVPNSGAATRAYGIYNISVASGTMTIRLNGTQIGSPIADVAGWTSTFNLFGMANTPGFSFHGDIGELLIFNDALASPNRLVVYNYLVEKWFSTSPDNISGLIHWVNPEAGIEADIDGYVTAWRDQSGNNTDWITETAVKPKLITNAQNGLSVLRTINYNDPTAATIQRMTQTAFRSGSNLAELFVIIKSNGPGDTGSPYQWAWSSFGTQGDFIGHYGFGTSIYETFGASARVQLASSPSVTSYGIFNLTRDTTTLKGTLNGIVLDTVAVSIFWDSTFKLFNFPNAKVTEYQPTYNIQFNGDVGEIIMYDRVLTATERQSIHNYLAFKWNLSTPSP